ncbi:MAG: PEGA domain protein [Methanomassiliicoccales archaeon PtaU1.Bin124]|nr:MAG: PEGA domain protein [Methanomassiliicoccales archaeon PtaU1.Bin124]
MNRKIAVGLVTAMLLASGILLVLPSSSDAYTSSSPIRLNGEGELLYAILENQWTGSGTPTNPVIITQLVINAPAGGSGIFLGNISSHVVIRDCYVYASKDTGTIFGPGSGIEVYNSSNVTIERCQILYNHIGVMLVSSNQVNVKNNFIITSSTYADGDASIYSVMSDRCNITNNQMSSEVANTLVLSGSDNNLISGNTVFDSSGYGIYLYDTSSNNRIFNNTILNCYYGISLIGGTENNTIIANGIQNSTSYGIISINTKNNDFYANILAKNNGANNTYSVGHIQAYDLGTNRWDVGGYGNCWRDLQTDPNDDGMVDGTYPISGGTMIDQHPVKMNVTVSWPTEKTTYTKLSYVNVSGTAIDGIGIIKVVWYNEDLDLYGNCSGTSSWIGNVKLRQGYNNVTIFVIDNLGARFSSKVRFISSNVGPSIVSSGGSSIYTNVQTPSNLTVKVSCAYDITYVNLTWHIGNVAEPAVSVPVSGKYYNYTIARSLNDGQNSLNVTATDILGNVRYLNISLVYDVTAPGIVSVFPPGPIAPTNTYFIIKFSEPMKQSTVHLDLGNISASYYWTGNTVTIVPTSVLKADKAYFLAINGTDLAGNALPSGSTITFTTAASATVYGRVDDMNGNPVEGAQVSLGGKTTTTASDGSYSIENLAAGNYTITVSKVGYATVTETIYVAAGASVQVANKYLEENAGRVTIEFIVASIVAMLALIGVGAYILRKK